MIHALLLSAAPLALPAQLNEVVTFEGRPYRVNVEGRTVKVFYREFLRRPHDAEAMARLIRVAESTTGCAVTLPNWSPHYYWFEGLLDCPTPK